MPSASPAAPSAATANLDPLLNKKLGNYNIVRKLSEDEWGPVYLANQTSMARPVAMKILSEDLQAKDPGAKQHFQAMAQAKAAVKHPSIIPVYEAGETAGRIYYTYEYIDGLHLAALTERGATIDDKTALQIAKVAVNGLAYLHQNKIERAPLEASSIQIDKNKDPHLFNLAVLAGEGRDDFYADIAALSASIKALLPNGTATDPGLQNLLTGMAMGEAGGFSSWEALQKSITALLPKVIPADAVKITAQEQAAIRAVEKNRQEQKRSIMIMIGIFTVSLCLASWYLWSYIRGNERNLSDMVKIPAGEFIYQNGEKASAGEFWIDKYEVTIGQYGRFLAALEQNPTQYDSPEQPRAKIPGHIPGNNKLTWNIWYGRAKIGKPARFVPIDLNCPIFNVDYWDACAYAKWAGKRLPTEQEWEKAARGTDGRLYPWGPEFKTKKANLGKDYDPNPGPGSEGNVDGYFWWNPVDKMPGDCSPYGVIGMLGNVAEWTATVDSGSKNPVIRGGSFHTNEATLLKRATSVDSNTCLEFLGFRCVSETPPKKN